jgi:hypothetical protein
MDRDKLLDIADRLSRECAAESRAMRGEEDEPQPNRYDLPLTANWVEEAERMKREAGERRERAAANAEKLRLDFYNKTFGPTEEAMALLRQDMQRHGGSKTTRELNDEYEELMAEVKRRGSL